MECLCSSVRMQQSCDVRMQQSCDELLTWPIRVFSSPFFRSVRNCVLKSYLYSPSPLQFKLYFSSTRQSFFLVTAIGAILTLLLSFWLRLDPTHIFVMYCTVFLNKLGLETNHPFLTFQTMSFKPHVLYFCNTINILIFYLISKVFASAFNVFDI